MKRRTLFILTCVLLSASINLKAQTGTYTTAEETYNKKNLPGGGKTITLPHADDCPTCPTEPVPFDGGLSLIIAAGVGYGIKRANDQRKAKSKL